MRSSQNSCACPRPGGKSPKCPCRSSWPSDRSVASGVGETPATEVTEAASAAAAAATRFGTLCRGEWSRWATSPSTFPPMRLKTNVLCRKTGGNSRLAHKRKGGFSYFGLQTHPPLYFRNRIQANVGRKRLVMLTRVITERRRGAFMKRRHGLELAFLWYSILSDGREAAQMRSWNLVRFP